MPAGIVISESLQLFFRSIKSLQLRLQIRSRTLSFMMLSNNRKRNTYIQRKQ